MARHLPQQSPSPTESLLGRTDWVGAALSILVMEGVDAVKITRLAEALSVTRGSFYWHFRDRQDLLDELIAHWEMTNTKELLEVLDRSYDLTSGILAIFDLWIDKDRFDSGLESALRDWARASPPVRAAVARADERRVLAIADLFRRDGFEETEAFIRARILYFAQIGYYALQIEESFAERMSYLEAYFRGFTGFSIDPSIAEAYRNRRVGPAPPLKLKAKKKP